MPARFRRIGVRPLRHQKRMEELGGYRALEVMRPRPMVEHRSMIRIFVPGIPKPKGSVSAFPIKRKDGTVGTSIVHRAGAWEGTVATAASEQWPHPRRSTVP